MSRGHAPQEHRVNTVTVTCAANGPEDYDSEGSPYRPVTLADVEAWCAELRRLGAHDDLVLPEADGLVVTLDGNGGH